MFPKKSFFNFVISLFMVSILSSIVLFLYFTKPLNVISEVIQDLTYLPKSASKEIVILEIDNEAINRNGAWPWDRKILTQVINKLGDMDANTIVLNLPLNEVRPNDSDLVNSINNSSSKIVLQSQINDQNILLSPSFKSQLNAKNSSIGASNIEPKNRFFKPIVNHSGGCVTNLGLQAVLSFENKTKPICSVTEINVDDTRIDAKKQEIVFFGKEKTVPTLSINSLLDGKIKSELIANKLIFVGAGKLTQNLNQNEVENDQSFGRSLDSQFGQISEIETQASIASSILENNLLRPAPVYVEVALIILLLCCTFVLGRFVWPALSFSLSLCLLSGYILLPLWLSSQNIKLNLFYPSLALILGWSLGVLYRILYDYRQEYLAKSNLKYFVSRSYLRKLNIASGQNGLQPRKNFSTILSLKFFNLDNLSDDQAGLETVKLIRQINILIKKAAFRKDGLVINQDVNHYKIIWNTFLEDPQHAFNACKTAVHIQSKIEAFAVQNNRNIQFGVGVSTGEILFGNLSQTEQINFQTSGQVSKLAGKFSDIVSKYSTQILIGENTYNALRRSGNLSKFKIEKVDEILMDGKDEKVKLYSLEDVSTSELLNQIDTQDILLKKKLQTKLTSSS